MNLRYDEPLSIYYTVVLATWAFVGFPLWIVMALVTYAAWTVANDPDEST